MDSPELRSLALDWAARVDDRLVCEDGTLAAAIEAAGVTLLSYRALRELARNGA